MDPIAILKASPSVAEVEATLRRASGGMPILAGSKTAEVLDKYRKARAAIARAATEASARALGVAIAAAEDSMTPEDAAKVAAECVAYFNDVT